MKFFTEIFGKKKKAETVPLPLWEQTVEIMYDKNLSFTAAEILQVVYTKDKTKRAVVIKNDNGLYGYGMQELFPFDEYEWQFVSQDENALPGMRLGTATGSGVSSYFSSEEDAVKKLMTEPWYRHNFLNEDDEK